LINAYDEVPYSAAAHAQTHPENLRLIAVLLGLDPIAARIARVLEIGCANGTNLFPMAEAYPDAHFVGLDYSQKQIDQAENYKQALGINNIEFHALDVVAIPKAISSNLGQFDYIICHGVFSWVEESVRLAILHMIRNHLSSNGVAFLSYNCYPGWKVREIARDMMLYHGNQFTEPGQRYKQARAMAEFVHENHNGENDVYGKLLEDSLNIIKSSAPDYVMHEYLEVINHPFYFNEVCDLAKNEGLAYLGDGNIPEMFAYGLSKKTEDALNQVARNDYEKREQYLDFLRNRMFRNSLFVHSGSAIQRQISIDLAQTMFFTANCRPSKDKSKEAAYETPTGQTLNAHTPLIVWLLDTLIASSPRFMSYEAILRLAKEKFDIDKTALQSQLSEALLRLISMSGVHARLDDLPMPVPAVKPNYPFAPHFSRLVAKANETVPSLLHGNVKLSVLQRIILQKATGKCTVNAIVDDVETLFKAGQLKWNKPDGSVAIPEKEAIQDMVKLGISELRDLSLLY
jgi:methyltransferase-like protein/2-polyprenyl-3-methyl-5-hydroxy-6-metoxy-1,4-benzoquinol methylase